MTREEVEAAVTEGIEDCYDPDCNDCSMLAPTPCPEHIDLGVMVEKITYEVMKLVKAENEVMKQEG